MPRKLTANHLKEVRKGLAAVARHHAGKSPKLASTLGESFEAYMLPADHLPAEAYDTWQLRDAIRRTGNWYHQLLGNKKAIGSVQSGAPGPAINDWSVQSLFLSRLAGKIQRTLKKVYGKRSQDKIDLQLVAIPAFHMHVFLVEDEQGNKVYVIESPYKEPGPIEGRVYAESQFLKRLLSVSQVRGLISE